MRKLPPVHPGEVLLEDFMKPNGLTAYRVAKDIGVPPRVCLALMEEGAAACLIKPIDSAETLVALEMILSYVEKKCVDP